MREHGPVMPLEQACLYPGRWNIEGYKVIRRTGRSARKWPSEWWITFSAGDEPVIVRTLPEVRDWIRGQR
jgi:hypothetical protein